jgi:hypothetical protein
LSNSWSSEKSGLKEIEVRPAVHLTFDEFELRYLSFDLTIGPGLRDGDMDGRPFCGDAGRERCHKATVCIGDPRFEIDFSFMSDHGVESIDERPRFRERRNALLDGCDGDGFGLAQMISLRCHQPCNRPGGRQLLQLLVTDFLGTATPRRPFADHPQGASEALLFQAAPELGAIAAATGSLRIKERQMFIQGALTRSEDV